MSAITVVCLDFDGTIMRYDPTEHFHPEIIGALNTFERAGVEWVAHSGRTFESQLQIILHCTEVHGLRHRPVAICHHECFIHVREGGAYAPLEAWNGQALRWLAELDAQVQAKPFRDRLDVLIRRYAPEVYRRESVNVFHLPGPDEERLPFVQDLNALLSAIPFAATVCNGEWITINDARLGKGNVLKAYLEYRELHPACVLAAGDHENDLSMLDGRVTPHVACPGNAYPSVREAVQRAGGYVASAHGPEGTLEAFGFYLPGMLAPSPLTS